MTITANGKTFEVREIYEDDLYVGGQTRPALHIKTAAPLTKEQADALYGAMITLTLSDKEMRTIAAYDKTLSCEIILTRASDTENALAAVTAERDTLRTELAQRKLELQTREAQLDDVSRLLDDAGVTMEGLAQEAAQRQQEKAIQAPEEGVADQGSVSLHSPDPAATASR
jgi:hypothetical protein